MDPDCHPKEVLPGISSFLGENPAAWTALAAATLCLLPVILVFVLFQRAFVEGVAGAVKS